MHMRVFTRVQACARVKGKLLHISGECDFIRQVYNPRTLIEMYERTVNAFPVKWHLFAAGELFMAI